ncbi:hypothetical protein BLA29_011558 [Euroglyphus maynei]|uniref:Uncharacterized protein n=1 Tax=Euroglyphus maynei TaxID=6958 RepID=A0A1Y3B3K3_EURMA|nr:hypothetical protein BLA29_011558 [Euroglyphus maynei]
MAKHLNIRSLLTIILILIFCFDMKSCSAQIFRQTSDGFNVDVGDFVNLNYGRRSGSRNGRGRGIDLRALSGLVNFDLDRRGIGRRPNINVDAFGLGGNRDRSSST